MKMEFIRNTKQLNDLLVNGQEEGLENNAPRKCAIIYVHDDSSEHILIDFRNLKVSEEKKDQVRVNILNEIKIIIAKTGRYIPIYEKNTCGELFPKEEYYKIRNTMRGISKYSEEDYQVSERLYLPMLEQYKILFDKNERELQAMRNPIIREVQRICQKVGLTCSFGQNSGGDVELIEAGSTGRNTNIPSLDKNKKWDFDFTVRVNPDKIWILKEALKENLTYESRIKKSASYKLRLNAVSIPGTEEKVDIDFAFATNKDEYVSNDMAIAERLENIRKQSENKYRLVIANIVLAKDFMKKIGAYKQNEGGLGGIGIETWILQHGGSFYDAACDFLLSANKYEYKAFKNNYPIVSLGENHTDHSKRKFKHQNYTAKLSEEAFEKMKRELNRSFGTLRTLAFEEEAMVLAKVA